MKKIFKMMLITLALSLAGGATIGCAKSESDNFATKSQKTTLQIAKIGTAPLDNPMLELAEIEGYLDKYGVALDYSVCEMSLIAETMGLGKADASYVGYTKQFESATNGADLVYFAGTITGGTVLFCRKEDYEELSNPENWKGKTIVSEPKDTAELVIADALKEKYNYTENMDYTHISADNPANGLLGVQKGNADIAAFVSQFTDTAESLGLIKLAYLNDLYPGYICCRQVAYGKSLRENRDSFVAYLKAQICALKDLYDDEKIAISLLSQKSGETENYVKSYVYDMDNNGYRIYNTDPLYNITKSVYEIMVHNGYVEEGTEFSTMTDISIYAEALKELIKENPDEEWYKEKWEEFVENNNEYPGFDETYGDGYLES